MVLYPIGTTKACYAAAEILQKSGFSVTDHPSPEVTALLLDVPSFRENGLLRSGESLASVLEQLPESVTILGGNPTPEFRDRCHFLDLLADPFYLAQNAAITASCAIALAGQMLQTTLPRSRILIIGWGRIGKCLARQLRGMGADPTIAVRKPEDLAMLRALGYDAVSVRALAPVLPGIRLLLNTAPAPILTETDFPGGSRCLKLDLASRPGILCPDAIRAGGLPGKLAPESSGALIAETVERFRKEGKL